MSQAELPPGVQVLERGWLSSNSGAVLWRAVHGPGRQRLLRACRADGGAGGRRAAGAHARPAGQHPSAQRPLRRQRRAAGPLAGPAQTRRAWRRRWRPGDSVVLGYQPTGQQPPAFSPRRARAARHRDRTRRRAWQVHAAPGHDPDSVILFEPRSAHADPHALWENGFGVAFPNSKATLPSTRWAAPSIERLGPHRVIPGHGPALRGRGAGPRPATLRPSCATRPAMPTTRKVLLKFRLLESARWPSPSGGRAAGTPHFQGTPALRGRGRDGRLDRAAYAGTGALEGVRRVGETVHDA